MFKDHKNLLLKFDKISFGYKKNKPIISEASFSIFKNEYVCIIGSNGCGKSTLIKILAGLLKPWSGSIIFNNELISKNNIKKLKDQVGIVFDNTENQFIGLSPEDDIAFGLENQCIDRKKMKTIIDNVSKYVGVYDLLKSDINNLSGGQKQLVAITSVLATNPQIIIFDEATSMLDNRSKIKINDLILSLKNNKHKTIINITHDMDEAIKADRIIVINEGKVALIGTPQQVLTNKKIESFFIDKPFVYKFNEMLNDEK